VKVTIAQGMRDAVLDCTSEATLVVKVAAVAYYPSIVDDVNKVRDSIGEWRSHDATQLRAKTQSGPKETICISSSRIRELTSTVNRFQFSFVYIDCRRRLTGISQ
jgi:hypothetical protein